MIFNVKKYLHKNTFLFIMGLILKHENFVRKLMSGINPMIRREHN